MNLTTKDMEFDTFSAQIDEHRLDIEWKNQPAAYHHWSIELANAQKIHDINKAKLDVIKAELDKTIRDSPDKYGLIKITEPIVAAAVLMQSEHKAALKSVIKAKHDVDILKAAVFALNHKKDALENLVRLRLADYYSEPRADPANKETINEMEKKITRGGRRQKKS